MYNHAFTCTVCDWKSKPDISLLKCTKCHNPLKIEYFNENTTVVHPATSGNPLARNAKQKNSSVMLSMNYWNIYMIACEIVIELLSENLNFRLKYDPAHVEDSAIYKKKKNKHAVEYWYKVIQYICITSQIEIE